MVPPASFDRPVPVLAVSTANLPRRPVGAAVMLRLTIDEEGRPANIRVLSDRGEALDKDLVATVSQGRFIAARRAGVPMKGTVELPLTLVEG
jgi:TonB family protein